MHHLAIRFAGSAAILLPTLIGIAQAQQSLQLPRSELSIPGAVMKSSSVSAPDIDISAYSDVRGAEAMAMKFSEEIPHTRGAQDVSLFRADAPSVVLILTKDALGSGSLLQDNLILTNFHVVDHNREVTVIFKPANANGRPSQDEVVRGDVVKIDVQRDLALIRPRSLPNHSVLPLQIASKEIEVGADVAAIGHPVGQDWTFTKGIVSAIRPDFEWPGDGGVTHRATVIQTQTPRNPGNSGGPLLSDDGKIVGVNSFAQRIPKA
jgi:S1-C subfamily serine protease